VSDSGHDAAASGSGSGIGWESHCDHGSYRLDHRMVDWQPFDYMTMQTVSSGRSVTKPPPSAATFAFEELPGERCKLSFRVRLANRSLVMRAVFALVRPVVRREWKRHFQMLARVLQEDAERAGAGVTF
jgi:hypothetical protein